MNIKKLLTVENIVLLSIFCVIVFLRFWKVPQLFFFNIDEEYQSLLALSIIKDFHIIWIGLSAADTGFYIGPGLVYLHSLLLWISKLDPVILGYTASFIGSLTTLTLFFIVKYLFDKKTAIVTTIIYSFSTFVIYFDRRFWNSTVVPLITILLYFSFIKALKNTRWLILTFFLLGLSFHIHASLFIFIPIAIIVIYRYVLKNKKIDLITIIFSVLIFLIVYSPLLVFDFVHNFDNLKTPIRMLKKLYGGNGELMIVKNFNVLKTTLAHFWFDTNQLLLISCLLFILSVIAIIYIFSKKKNNTEKTLAIIICLYLLMFIFYPGKILEYYYLGFFPFFALVIALFFKNLKSQVLIIIGIIYMSINIYLISNWPINNGLAAKKELIKKTMMIIGKKNYSLETNHKYLYFGGWRYLFEAYGKKPNQSQADEMFGWIYPKEISQEKPELKITISDSEINSNKKPLKIIRSGIYRSYVFKNE